MDYTIREIDNFANGADHARRTEMATMLWAAHAGAGFYGHVLAGKRLPNIEQRLRKIMEQPGKKRRSEIADVVERMNLIARRAGLPKPRPRRGMKRR